jgi:Flp pilus assembly protein TadD
MREYDRSPCWKGRIRAFSALLLLGCLSSTLSACGSIPDLPTGAAPPTATVEESAEIKYYPSDQPLHTGMEYFTRGQYGIAQRHFRDAVEKAPKDPTAWIGLAASYDRLRRFDLADQAYAAAIRLTGETVQILNNQGYSYMLRGDLAKARLKFQKAYQLDPTNPTIVNNLELLNSSQRFIHRP